MLGHIPTKTPCKSECVPRNGSELKTEGSDPCPGASLLNLAGGEQGGGTAVSGYRRRKNFV